VGEERRAEIFKAWEVRLRFEKNPKKHTNAIEGG